MNQYTDNSYYNTDLAYVHDVGHGAPARHAADFVADQLRRAGFDTGTVVDLGCGSGIFARKLQQQGYQLIGVDYSEAMIAIARQQAPEATFYTGSYLDFDIPTCIAVTSISECLNYLFDPSHNQEKLRTLFTRIYRALVPGGIFVFDIVEPGLLGPEPVQKRVVEHDEWTMFLDYSEDRTAHTLERKIFLFRKTGDCYRKSTEIHTLQLYKRESLQLLLEEIGFSVTLNDNYNGLFFREHGIGFTAVKP